MIRRINRNLKGSLYVSPHLGQFQPTFGQDDETYTEQHGDVEDIFSFFLEGGLLGSM